MKGKVCGKEEKRNRTFNWDFCSHREEFWAFRLNRIQSDKSNIRVKEQAELNKSVLICLLYTQFLV